MVRGLYDPIIQIQRQSNPDSLVPADIESLHTIFQVRLNEAIDSFIQRTALQLLKGVTPNGTPLRLRDYQTEPDATLGTEDNLTVWLADATSVLMQDAERIRELGLDLGDELEEADEDELDLLTDSLYTVFPVLRFLWVEDIRMFKDAYIAALVEVQ